MGEAVFQLLDEDRSGEVTYTEFAHHLWKMKSQDLATKLSILKYDVRCVLSKVQDLYARATRSFDNEEIRLRATLSCDSVEERLRNTEVSVHKILQLLSVSDEEIAPRVLSRTGNSTVLQIKKFSI